MLEPEDPSQRARRERWSAPVEPKAEPRQAADPVIQGSDQANKVADVHFYDCDTINNLSDEVSKAADVVNQVADCDIVADKLGPAGILAANMAKGGKGRKGSDVKGQNG